MAQKTWTPKEVQFLLDHYGRDLIETIADELGRSVASVRCKAKSMGLSYAGYASESHVVVKPKKTIPDRCARCVWVIYDTARSFCPFGAGCAKERLRNHLHLQANQHT